MIVVGALVEIAGNGVDPVDGGVAIWRDGDFVYGCAEERITRKKYSGGFRRSLRFGLDQLGLNYGDIDAYSFVSYGEPFNTRVEHIARQAPELAPFADRIHFTSSHHEAHALGAARLSPWDESLVVVLDNEGLILGPQLSEVTVFNSMERASYYLASAGSLDLLSRDLFGRHDTSLGEAYRRFSYYCGFPSHQLAGKTMALAPYGNARAFGSLQVFASDGSSIKVDLNGRYDRPAEAVVDFFKRNGFDVAPPRGADDPFSDDHLNAAAFVQEQLEIVAANRISALLDATGQERICLSGGVAYNCRLVAHLEEVLGVPVFVPPSPGDQGLGVGAAISYLERSGIARGRYPPIARLGGVVRCSSEEVRVAANSVGAELTETNGNAELARLIVECLIAGGIVAIVEGKSEFGRRALGARSLLSLPQETPAERLRQLKRREWFRPFGASMLRSAADRAFGNDIADAFMLRAPKAIFKEELGNLLHIDGTLRAQVVDDDNGTLIASVLRTLVDFGKPGVVINTSFNLDGEPLVETEAEGIALFVNHDQIDGLALANSGFYLARGG